MGSQEEQHSLKRFSHPGKECPECGVAGGMHVSVKLVAKTTGTYSIGGAQRKVIATERAVLWCNWCYTRWFGHLEDVQASEDGETIVSGHFVQDLDA